MVSPQTETETENHRRPRYDSIKSQSSSIAPSAWGVRPPSPSFSTTTTGSKVNMPANHMLITRKDLRASIACFEELMAAAKAYRNALLAMSQATAAFATAMEACSRVKGCRASNSTLAGASGLQYLVSNHEQILADTVYRQFEIPLLEALDHYKLVTADRLVAYEKSLSEQSTRIRKTEAENLKHGRRRKRDLQHFRQALADLQRQVDELDAIKAGYHEEVLEGEDEIWDTIMSKVAFVIRSQLDFFEKIAGKASDPIIEPLVASIPDPFDSYGPPKEDGQIFSVLAPLSMLDSSPQSPNPGLSRTHSSAAVSTTEADRGSPARLTPFPTSVISPSKPETMQILAVGENGWFEEGDGNSSGSGSGRARRELSVIEERDSNSLVTKDEEVFGATRISVDGDQVEPEDRAAVPETEAMDTLHSDQEARISSSRLGDASADNANSEEEFSDRNDEDDGSIGDHAAKANDGADT